jgi:hypothetical protein
LKLARREKADELLGFKDFDVYLKAAINETATSSTEKVKARAKNPKTLLDGPGPATKEEKANGDSSTNRPKRGTTGADYLTARIARDHPDILKRMKAGEFKSVRQAAIAAGIVKVPTHLKLTKRHWSKISQAEQDEFWEWERVKRRARRETVRRGEPLTTSDEQPREATR